ncbi:MAG: site-2 protease family protein [Clostridia bacterium]|nr:site-2 protease family protein [Clostridia bacterium]
MDWLLDFLFELAISAPVVLIALTVHELCHGLCAYWLGDPTAKYAGRLTLNPLKHLDPIGAICLLLFRYGWAKPVPVNTRYFKRPRLYMALTSFAGPLSNLILAFVGAFFYVLSVYVGNFAPDEGFLHIICLIWVNFSYYFVFLNISLAIFNLLPIPPLDGSNILFSFLPESALAVIRKYQHYISLAFFVILLLDTRILGGYITYFLSVAVNWIFDIFVMPFTLIFF